MTFLRLAAASVLAACLVGACSNTHNKKKPIGDDAATGDGSNSGGGAGGAEAGVDAAPDVVDAMPDVTADVASDATDAMTCGTGTVNLVGGGCVLCPPDAGTAEAGMDSGAAGAGMDSGAAGAGADAATGPYSAFFACSALGGAATQYDPSTNTLTVKVNYPLQLDTMDYQLDLAIQTPTGAPAYPTVQSTAPLVGNTLTVDLSSQLAGGNTLVEVGIYSLTGHDACGRTTSFIACTTDPNALKLDPPDAGGAWPAVCSSSFC